MCSVSLIKHLRNFCLPAQILPIVHILEADLCLNIALFSWSCKSVITLGASAATKSTV